MKVKNKKIYYKFFKENLSNEFNPKYDSREARNKFMAGILNKNNVSKMKNILNLGSGGEKFLSKNLKDKNFKIVDVDFEGDVDIDLNLDNINSLPFNDSEFDITICLDVLEHLENFHLMNKELIRVSQISYISLPISSNEIIHELLLDKSKYYMNKDSGFNSKFYGLPLEKPNDRHRWYIYFLDVVRFYKYFSEENNLSVTFYLPQSLKRSFIKFLLPRNIYYNFLVPYIWIKIEKQI